MLAFQKNNIHLQCDLFYTNFISFATRCTVCWTVSTYAHSVFRNSYLFSRFDLLFFFMYLSNCFLLFFIPLSFWVEEMTLNFWVTVMAYSNQKVIVFYSNLPPLAKLSLITAFYCAQDTVCVIILIDCLVSWCYCLEFEEDFVLVEASWKCSSKTFFYFHIRKHFLFLVVLDGGCNLISNLELLII